MTYLTTEDLAERWDITPEAVRMRKHRGKLPEPDRMFGKTPAWLVETIEEFEGNGRVDTEATREVQ